MDNTHTVPIRETLEVLADLVKAGRIRRIGVSNETPWGVGQFLKESELHGLDPAQVVIRFSLRQKFLTTSIIGATNLEQLKADIEAAETVVPQEVWDGIEKIHAERPNPVQ